MHWLPHGDNFSRCAVVSDACFNAHEDMFDREQLFLQVVMCAVVLSWRYRFFWFATATSRTTQNHEQNHRTSHTPAVTPPQNHKLASMTTETTSSSGSTIVPILRTVRALLLRVWSSHALFQELRFLLALLFGPVWRTTLRMFKAIPIIPARVKHMVCFQKLLQPWFPCRSLRHLGLHESMNITTKCALFIMQTGSGVRLCEYDNETEGTAGGVMLADARGWSDCSRDSMVREWSRERRDLADAIL